MLFSFSITLIAGLSTILGVLFTYIKTNNINKFICISLSFSMGVMILLSIKELIPIPLKNILISYNLPWNILISLIMPLNAIFLVYLINKSNNDTLYRVGVISMIILLIHNIPEGIATFITTLTNKRLGLKLALAIMAHNIPEGICISIPIYYAKKSRRLALILTTISGLAEPLGGLLIYILFKDYINLNILNIILYFIGNIMIFISLKIILKEVLKYNNLLWILYGLILSLFILLV